MVPEHGAVPLPLAPRTPALPNAFSSIVSQQLVPSLPGAGRGSRLELRTAPDSSYRLQGFLFLFWFFFSPLFRGGKGGKHYFLGAAEQRGRSRLSRSTSP